MLVLSHFDAREYNGIFFRVLPGCLRPYTFIYALKFFACTHVHVLSMPIVLLSITCKCTYYYVLGYQALLKERVRENEARMMVKPVPTTRTMAKVNAPLVCW